jgi:CspA family cold shock protein
MACHIGLVKWFDAKKGYGFILHPNDGTDIFVHYSQIHSDKRFKTLRTGQVVEFELVDGPKGLHAHQVMPVNEPQDEFSDEISGDGELSVPAGMMTS